MRVGGAGNHRFGLDGVLIKENHIRAAGARRPRSRRPAREGGLPTVSGEDAEEASAADLNPTRVLLDNFASAIATTVRRLKETRWRWRCQAGFASRRARLRDSGVNYISVGSITHSAPALEGRLMDE